MGHHGDMDEGQHRTPRPGEPPPPRLTRRRFVQSAGAGLVSAAVAGDVLAGTARAGVPELTPQPVVPAELGQLAAVAFYGSHQAGILTPQPPAAAFVAFDIVGTTRAELADLFCELTTLGRALSAGGTPPDLGVASPPSDSGILGPVIVPDALTLTLGVGASLFDDRFGLGDRMPKRLTTMQPFPNDDLDPSQCHGDVMLQICAGSVDTILHALRLITKHTRGAMQIRYRIDGFLSPRRPSGAPRNLQGFNDGIANPAVDTPSVAKTLLWAGADEPAWAAGGSYQVVRIIRMFVEFWDRVSLEEQETMIGRRRDSGAPLTGNSQDDVPDYAGDPVGAIIPLNAHIRLANPRKPSTASSELLRRGYNYDRGVDNTGNLDQGLVFVCYQQDLLRQFVTVQTRLLNEPLVDYISPVGGGYYFALPGVTDSDDWYGRGLLA
jgi:deferrochelatase/peroxidase EfeB